MVSITSNGIVLQIDNRAFYGNGLYGHAVDHSTLEYQKHLWTVFAFLEGYELEGQLKEELEIILECLRRGYHFYNLTSYLDTVFCLTYKYGMSLLVCDNII